jgi:hypothetical protein
MEGRSDDLVKLSPGRSVSSEAQTRRSSIIIALVPDLLLFEVLRLPGVMVTLLFFLLCPQGRSLSVKNKLN